MSLYQQYQHRTVISLNGIWQFTMLDDQQDIEKIDVGEIDFDDIINVPGCFDMLPKYIGKRAGTLYKQVVRIPPGTAAGLYCGGLSIWARVFVDGLEIYEHLKPFSSFFCPIPTSKCEERELVIYVDNRFNGDKCPLVEPYHDYYLFGGLFRDVSLHLLDDVYIKNVKINATDYKGGTVRVSVLFEGELPPEAEISYAFDKGEAKTLTAAVCDNILEFEHSVADFRCWSPDAPSLHTLHLRYKNDDMLTRFGFRKIEAVGNQIHLNGKPIKLLGFNRHETHPALGAALPLQPQIADIQYLKDMGCNFIRGSHYPQDKNFLDLCDRMGMLLWEESVGWQQKAQHFTNKRYRNLCREQTRDMIEADWNHPSIILWGFQNEADSDVEEAKLLFPDLIALCRQLDPTRLVTYATHKHLKDLFLDQLDVISFNMYPGWYNPEPDYELDRSEQIVPKIQDCISALRENGLGDKPFIISEIGAGAIYGFRDVLSGMWTEEYQATYLETVCREVMDNNAIAGVGLWQFCDGRTYNGSLAVRRPRAFNNKGILDEYRRPKLAYKAVKNILKSQ